MNTDLNSRLISAAEQMVSYLDIAFATTHKLERENASRVIWLVAISGFAIINLPNIITSTLSPAIIIIPWVVTVVLGVITHWLHRNLSIQNFSLYTVKREQLLVFIINGPEMATLENLNNLIENKTSSLTKTAKNQSRATTTTTIMEFITLIGFVVSMCLAVFWAFA